MLCYLLYQLRRDPAGPDRRNDMRRRNRRHLHRLGALTVTGTVSQFPSFRGFRTRLGEPDGLWVRVARVQ